MDLEVKDVSELLNVPEEILLEWISEGKIPAYIIQNKYRFSREEIENWLMENPNVPRGEKHNFNLFRALTKGDVYTDITATTKESILEEATKRIADKYALDGEALYDRIIDREYLVPTAIGMGFAIPHARDFFIPCHIDVVTAIFLKEPISYGALDGNPVHTLFVLLACDDRRHLSLLSKITHLISNDSMRAFMATHPEKNILLDSVKEWESTVKSK